MRNRSIGVLLIAALFAPGANAQEQFGSIEGVLTDTSGGILPGVTVEAKNTKLGTVSTTYTNGAGTYRFPALRPSTYEVTASLQGFVPSKVENITVRLGQLLKVDMVLKVGGVAEEIEVTASAPIIDVKRSASTISIRDEMIEKLPKGRNFTSVVTQSASANDEDTLLAGISIDGASGSENRYIIDGIDTTDIQDGESGKNLVTDFVDEVQVKSSGYDAEYGGATGGVINVITKSGGNDWSGSFGMQLRTDNSNGPNRPSLRLNEDNTDEFEYVTWEHDDFVRAEPGFALGGPIISDRAWFFGGYQPDIRTYERTVTFKSDDSTRGFNETYRTHYTTANIHAQISSKLRGRFSTTVSSQYRDGLHPANDGTDNPDADWNLGLEEPDVTMSGNIDFTATNNLYFGARAGRYAYDTRETGVANEPWLQCVGANADLGVPEPFQCVNSQRNIPRNDAAAFDEYTRTSFDVDGTLYAKAGGDHAIKGGVQWSRITNKVLDGYQQPRYLFYWDQARTTLQGDRVAGDFGVLRVLQIVTTGDIASNNTGLFLQDQWSVNDRLTLNLGIRTERELVPSFRTDLGQDENAIDFGYGDKLAPRVGFSYDVLGDGNWKAFGSWGVFYDITKLEMPRGSFGGDQWIDYWYELDRFDWSNFGGDSNCYVSPAERLEGKTASCEGLPLIESSDRRFPANVPGQETIDPDLDPMKSQEFTLGLQHRLNDTTSIGMRYVHKQLDKTIEDVGIIDPEVGEIFFIANPGFGIAQNTLGTQFPAQPPATRDYDGVELEFTRRMSKNWSVHASYLWSRLNGNYSGLASSDEHGRSSPNVNRFFDGLIMSFDANGQPVFGPLGTDRPHQFKVQGLYDFNFGSTVGLNFYVASGTPVTRMADLQEGLPVAYLGRLSDGRTPTFSKVDFFWQHEFRFGGRNALQVSVNVLNLLDTDTATTLWQDEVRDNIGISNEDFFSGFSVPELIAAQDTTLDPRFLQTRDFQNEREIRFGIKYLF